MSGAGLPCSTSSAVTTTGKSGARPVFLRVLVTTSLSPPEAMAMGRVLLADRANSTTGPMSSSFWREAMKMASLSLYTRSGSSLRPWCLPRSAATRLDGTPPSA